MNYQRRPPRIHHIDRPQNYRQMAADACHNVKLPAVPTRLFLYYVDQATDFRPSLKEIQKNTDIRKNKISEHRSLLAQRTLISYVDDDGGAVIIIDWKRISYFARLETPLPFHRNNKHASHFFPKTTEPVPAKNKTIRELGKEYTLCFHENEEKWRISSIFQKTLAYADHLTETEYGTLIKCFPEYNPEIKPLNTQDIEAIPYLSFSPIQKDTSEDALDSDWISSIPTDLPF